MRTIEARLRKIERDKQRRNSDRFFLLWIPPGADAQAAANRERGKGALEGEPIYCLPWSRPEPMPQARWVTGWTLSDSERDRVVEAICDKALKAGMKTDDQTRFTEWDDRALIPAAIGMLEAH
jgi:hypothetical protein